jgi:tRNA(Arg) A34 adenosine deaminase TadA
MTSADFMREAIRLAEEGMNAGRGGPFGCVIVRGGEIVGRGCNMVLSTNDPTAHAEIVAIRQACAAYETWNLADCRLYTTCEPCPMCLAAVYWARIPLVHYACTRADAAMIGFDDEFIYSQIPLPPDERFPVLRMQTMLRDEALPAFHAWNFKPDKVRY